MSYKKNLTNAIIGFSALTLSLFSSACSQLPKPTPTQVVRQYTAPAQIESIRNYRPTETEIRTVGAIKYLSSSQPENRQAAEDYVLRTYGSEIGNRAINFSRLSASKKEDIVLNAVRGNPYPIEVLQQKLGTTSPYILSAEIDYVFDDVFGYDIDEDEMKEFEKIADDYEKTRQKRGMSPTTGIDPELKALVVYSWVFVGRTAVTGDPLEAQRYAWVLARNPKTREGGFDVIYDTYYEGKEGLENLRAQTKRDFNPEVLKEKANRLYGTLEERARQRWKEVEKNLPTIRKELEEKAKQQGEELKRKAEEELRRKQEEAKTRAEELRRQAEEAARRKADELRRRGEEEARKKVKELEDWFKKYKK